MDSKTLATRRGNDRVYDTRGDIRSGIPVLRDNRTSDDYDPYYDDHDCSDYEYDYHDFYGCVGRGVSRYGPFPGSKDTTI